MFETEFPSPRSDLLNQLRREHYNATLVAAIEPGEDLRIFRVVPDRGVPPVRPGQFTTLGLGYWEPRVRGADQERLDEVHLRRLAKRAYSISCSIVDESGRLKRVNHYPYLEFYVALVRHAAKGPPALTPRLFSIQTGDRLFMEPRARGDYTLAGLPPEHEVFFFATGTGEAPHNAMIAELLASGHRGRILSAVSVRLRRDAAYRSIHAELARRYANYHYLVITTREPENLEPLRPGYLGKCHLQDVVASGDIKRQTGMSLDPAQSQVFLCGNPAMIGIGHPAVGRVPEPLPGSMLELLTRRGFILDRPGQRGNLHIERYW